MRLAFVVAAALVAAPSAHGKGCARITTTTPVVAGKPARITLTTLLPTYSTRGALVDLQPYADGIVAMSVFVQPPFGNAVLLQLVRSRSDRSRWTARFVFSKAGTWWVTSTALPDGLPASCSGKKRVVVRRPNS